MIKKLPAKGYLKKARNSENERTIRLSLTPKGLQVIDDFTAPESGIFGTFLKETNTLSDKETDIIESFIINLEKMLDAKLA